MLAISSGKTELQNILFFCQNVDNMYNISGHLADHTVNSSQTEQKYSFNLLHIQSRLPEIHDCDKTLLCHCMTLTRVECIVYVGSRHAAAAAAAAAGMFYILLHADRISAHAEPRRTRALTRLRLSGAVSRPRATCHISSLYNYIALYAADDGEVACVGRRHVQASTSLPLYTAEDQRTLSSAKNCYVISTESNKPVSKRLFDNTGHFVKNNDNKLSRRTANRPHQSGSAQWWTSVRNKKTSIG